MGTKRERDMQKYNLKVQQKICWMQRVLIGRNELKCLQSNKSDWGAQLEVEAEVLCSTRQGTVPATDLFN